jgi:hypothetical protein
VSAPALPVYGYAHRARVVRLGDAEETYLVEVPDLAPGILSGPFMSAVRDLQPGDSVLVVQLGVTSGNLVIVGRLPERPPPFTLPIEIGDVTGLTAALDDRATDVELAALQDAVNLSLSDIGDKDDEQDGRLDVLETARAALEAADTALAAADAALDARLDVVEPLVTTHTGQISALQAADTAFATYSAIHQLHDNDMYGDRLSSMQRVLCTNTRTTGANATYIFRTRVRQAMSVSQLRVCVTAAGVAGTTTAALYRSATGAGAFPQLATATNALATLGEASFTLGATSLAAGDYVLLVLKIGTTYTTVPAIGTAQNSPRNNIVNPASGRFTWVTKTAAGALPATIDVQDGTWTVDSTPWWIALA